MNIPQICCLISFPFSYCGILLPGLTALASPMHQSTTIHSVPLSGDCASSQILP